MRCHAMWLPTLLMQCRRKQEEMNFWYAIYPLKTWSIKQAVSSHFKGRSVCVALVMVELLSFHWTTLFMCFQCWSCQEKVDGQCHTAPAGACPPLLSVGSGFSVNSVPEESHMQYSRGNIWLGGLWNKCTALILQYPCCTGKSSCYGVQQDRFTDLSEPWIQLL